MLLRRGCLVRPRQGKRLQAAVQEVLQTKDPLTAGARTASGLQPLATDGIQAGGVRNGDASLPPLAVLARGASAATDLAPIQPILHRRRQRSPAPTGCQNPKATADPDAGLVASRSPGPNGRFARSPIHRRRTPAKNGCANRGHQVDHQQS